MYCKVMIGEVSLKVSSGRFSGGGIACMTFDQLVIIAADVLFQYI